VVLDAFSEITVPSSLTVCMVTERSYGSYILASKKFVAIVRSTSNGYKYRNTVGPGVDFEG